VTISKPADVIEKQVYCWPHSLGIKNTSGEQRAVKTGR